MRTLLYVIAILLVAAGVAVGLGSFYAPGQVVIGLNLESAAILLTGGFIMLGIATVTAALLAVAEALAGSGRQVSVPSESAVGVPSGVDKNWPGNYGRRKSRGSGGDLPGFLRPARGGAGSGPLAGGGPPSPPGLGPGQPPPSPGGLFPDKPPARQSDQVPPVIVTSVDPGVPDDLQAAVEREAPSLDRPYPPPEVPLGPPIEEAAQPAAAAPSAEPAPGSPPASEDQLFVIEERLVRGKVARVLSDGTVEAETAEGWMRFENVEHLEEYLQAMGEV
jgi:hypothetical protein